VQAAQGEQCDGSAGGAMCPAGTSGAVSCDAMCQLDSSGCAAASVSVSTLWVGQDHSCVVTSGGDVLCWGDNTNRAINPSAATSITTPTAYPGLPSGLGTLALGGNHMCVETATGGVKCWGKNADGQLGDGTTSARSAPVDVFGLSNIRALSAGVASSCVVNSSGGAMCWGNNSAGQLGMGTSVDQLVPGDVIGLSSGVSFVVASHDHTCARMSAGGIKCWGANASGQLGDGGTTPSSTPVDVSGLTTGTRFVTVGAAHACVVTGLGTVKCWGSNANGQLGDGTTTSRATPVDVAGLSDVKALSAGISHTCAITNAGAVKCWGSNTYGQLGDGTTTRRLTPVDVVGMTSGARVMISGADHVCALRTTGELRCWGRNGRGQLADPNTASKTTPSAIPGIR
jgi:alpha-tubulin suppressor-like RCC1 family protein